MEIMLDKVRQGAHGFALKTTHTSIKAEMLLLSAIRQFKINKSMRFYKRLSAIAIALLVLGILFAIVAYKLEIVKDEVQGPFDN
jgi:subtilase family serine protease